MIEPPDGIEPPEDVRLHLRDGTTVWVDCRYVGLVDGLNVWEVITTVDRGLVSSASVAKLPGRTSIRFPL